MGSQANDSPDSQDSRRQQPEPVSVGAGFIWGLVLGVILAASIIALAVQNTDQATIRFLFWDSSTPLIVVILVAFLLGVVITQLVGLVYRSRRKRKLRQREELKRLRDSG